MITLQHEIATTCEAEPARHAASVIISTRNRRDELRRAVESAVGQSIRPQVIVIDDGSDDGTAELVRREFPEVRLERAEVSRGYIVQRNYGARIADAPVVITMDDDAAFVSPHTIEQTLEDFDDPRVGAVAIPYIDIGKDPAPRQRAPESSGVYVSNNFRGTAGALRRDVFLKLGGFREFFLHQGEEDEFCLRLLQAGYVTRLGRAEPLHHFESPRRNRSRIIYHQSRNNILFAWYNVPSRHLALHLAGTTCNCIRAGARAGHLPAALHGCCMGINGMFHERAQRSPVSPAIYRLLRRLKKHGPAPLSEIEHLLPPLTQGSQQSSAGGLH